MSKFVNAIQEELTHTHTENGARAKNTSGNDCLDFFSTAGSLRDADDLRKYRFFLNAFREDPLTALKILFYVRDVRGGLGERDTFRTILHNAAINHRFDIQKNIPMIPEYGRFDDLYSLVGTPCEPAMWSYLGDVLHADIARMETGSPVSLMAKWIHNGNESSKKSRSLGILTANKLGYSVYEFKRIIRDLRKYIDIVETKMSANRWDEIDYSKVPSRAGMIYRNAFQRHDEKRYNEFINKVAVGEAKINTSTLYPYDIIEKFYKDTEDTNYDVLQTLWDNLPDYVDGSFNAIVMADTSGSMMFGNGRPFMSAVALAVYFAQRNTGAYHNLWMSFSSRPKYHKIKGDNLSEILTNFDTSDWGMNTNLESALSKILQTAIDYKVPSEEVPKSLIIISDMEIDRCETSKDWSFYDYMKSEYADYGYEIPNIVFWNVESRHDIFHADKSRKGVQLVSGQSASTFKNLMGAIGKTPLEFMYSVINSERYSMISLPE